MQAKKNNWIGKAIRKPGALHKELGVKQGAKIPAKKLDAAAKKGGIVGKRANLAKTLEGFKGKTSEMGAMHKTAMKSMGKVAKTAMSAINGIHRNHMKQVAMMAKPKTK